MAKVVVIIAFLLQLPVVLISYLNGGREMRESGG